MYGSLETERDEPPSSRRRLVPSRSSRRAAAGWTSNRRLGDRRPSSRRNVAGGSGGKGGSAVFTSMFHTVRATDRFVRAARQRRRERLAAASGSPGYSTRDATTTTQGYSFVYTMMNPRSHQRPAVVFKRFMAAVICIDLMFFIASTEPELENERIFYYAEGVTSTIFLVEYLARLATCTESKRFGRRGPFLGRLRYIVTIPALIDAFATFPFFLELMYPSLDLPTLTYLRMFRLLRILKTEGFARAFDSVNRVVFYNREILYVAAMLCVFLVLVTAVAMYYLRPRKTDLVVDAADFGSIAATMYLSTLMLTGQGGPEGSLPWYTQVVVLLTGIFSVAMFAIPASMLTWGFEAEAERLAVKARKRKAAALAAARAGAEGTVETGAMSFFIASSSSSESDAYASSSSVDTSDEEYFRIIAGDDDEEVGEEEDPAKAQALREIVDMFHRADDDGSGTLTKQEFVQMVEPLLSAASASASSEGGPPSLGATLSEVPNGEASGAPTNAEGGAVPAALAAALSSSSSSEVLVLSSRVARLEAKVDAMMSKLDHLIRMSERPSDRAFRDPFP